jgi:hypothetical protein
MDLLLLAKPGVHLYSLLHNSDTAWQAIRFYEHVNLGYGVLFSVSGCVSALALASDIRYYIRRYVAYHLFRTEHDRQIYATPALVTSRYLEHTDPFNDVWNYRLILAITESVEYPFICTRAETIDNKKNEVNCSIQAEYEILSTQKEWDEIAIYNLPARKTADR